MVGGLRGLCFQDTPWSTIGKICLYICRLFSHNVVSLNNKMAAMLVSHNLAGNKTFCHVNTSFCPNWFECVVKTLAIHSKIRRDCTTVQSVCPCKPNECERLYICRHKNGIKNAIMSQSDVCHSCQIQLTAVKMGHLLGLSAGTGKLCIFGHLGLVFIWSCFVSCLLLLLYYVICAPVLTEGTHLLTCITWWYCLLRSTIHQDHDMTHRGGFKKGLFIVESALSLFS